MRIISDEGASTESEWSDPEISDAVRYYTRHYQTGGTTIPQFEELEGVEGIDFPFSVIPLCTIGPDPIIVDIEDDSEEKNAEVPNKDDDGEGEDDEANDEGAEGETGGEDTPAMSSSRAYKEAGTKLSYEEKNYPDGP